MEPRIHENADEILVEVDLPSVDVDDVEVTALDHALAVRCRSFEREVHLPDEADVEHLSATLRGDTLELRAPKAHARPRRIPVHVPWRLNGSAFPD